MSKHRLRVLSASQFKAFECERAGVWEYCHGFKEKKGEASLLLGNRLHKIAEDYLKFGTDPDDTEVLGLWKTTKYRPTPFLVNYLPGQIFRHGMHLLPPPGTCHVEGQTKYATESGPWTGARDIVTALNWDGTYFNPYVHGFDPASARIQVWDHKTTTGEAYSLVSDEAKATGYIRFPDGSKVKVKEDQTRLSDDTQAITYAYDLMVHWLVDEVDAVWVYYRTDMEKPRKSWLVKHTFTREEVLYKLENRIDPKADRIRFLRENPPEDPNTLEPNLDCCPKYSGCAHQNVRCIVSLEQRIDHSGKKVPDMPSYAELLAAARAQNPGAQPAMTIPTSAPAPGSIAEALIPAPVAAPVAAPAPQPTVASVSAAVGEARPINQTSGQPVWVYGEPLQGHQFDFAQKGEPIWMVAVAHPTRAPSAAWAMAQPGWQDPYILPEAGFINPPAPLSPPAAPASPESAKALYQETSKQAVQLESAGSANPLDSLDREELKNLCRAYGLNKDWKNDETKKSDVTLKKELASVMAGKAVTEAYEQPTPAPVPAPVVAVPANLQPGYSQVAAPYMGAPVPFTPQVQSTPAPEVTPAEETAQIPGLEPGGGFTLFLNMVQTKGNGEESTIHFSEIVQAVSANNPLNRETVAHYITHVAKLGPLDIVVANTHNPETRLCLGVLERLARRIYVGTV